MKVKLLTDTAKLPTRGSVQSVGFDFYSDVDVILPPIASDSQTLECDISTVERTECHPILISTGCAIELPSGHVGLFRDRSSYGGRGIIVTAGVIDPDYRGEIFICLGNLNSFPVSISKGSKIAQMLVLPCWNGNIVPVTELSDTIRGCGGFGSTGA